MPKKSMAVPLLQILHLIPRDLRSPGTFGQSRGRPQPLAPQAEFPIQKLPLLVRPTSEPHVPETGEAISGEASVGADTQPYLSKVHLLCRLSLMSLNLL